jgi:2-oxoglutarate ferredoxin oxidoreductase subunit gamma
MQHATVFGGFGGQGLLFAGHVLAQAAVIEGRRVSWMPSYGPEMRGGTASCTVIIADHQIGSPIVDMADTVVALNPPSLAKFEPLLVPGGLLIVNATLIEAEAQRKDVEIAAIGCTALARECGDDRLVSVVALGARIARRPIVGREASTAGYPIPITEMLALLPGVSYAARGSIADPPLIGKTKAMVRRAFETQLSGGGLSIVEILSTCPVGWGLTPTESMEHLARDVVATYPLGVLADRLKGPGVLGKG